MKDRALQLLRQDFIKHNAIFLAGSLVIAVFNYIYYPVIGRLVSVSEYGEIQAVISIFMQLGIVLTAFGYVVTNIVNNTKDHARSERLILKLEQITLVVCVAIFALLCLSSVMLKTSLQFTSIVPLVLVGFLVVLNVPSTSRTYFLQGFRKLKEVSVSGIIFAVGKLALSVILILLGFNVVAVMMGYILAQMATLLYLLAKTNQAFPGLKESFQFNWRGSGIDRKIIKDELVYGTAILVLLSGITLLYTSDTITVRWFFSPDAAGMYSAVSAIARIVFFVTASVAGVLIATVKMEDSVLHNRAILYKSLGLVTLIGGAVALFFTLFPSFSVGLLFGKKYAGMAYLLPILSLLMLVCSYNNLLVSYEIALRRFKVIFTVALAIVLLVASVAVFHGSLMEMVACYLAANVVLFVLLSIQIMKRK